MFQSEALGRVGVEIFSLYHTHVRTKGDRIMQRFFSTLPYLRTLQQLGSIACAALLLVACGGKGGGDSASTPPTAQATTVTGTVTAPSGALAKAEPEGVFRWFASLFVSESHAQAGPGLQPVLPGTAILVFQVDNTGNPVTSTSNPSGILAQTTTGANGTFSVNLPAGTTLASNVIVQATTGTTPVRVCDPSTPGCPVGQTQLNCPAVANNLNINPAAELATRQILARIALAGANGNLTNYTRQEVAAFIGLVQATVAADPALTAGNLTDTFTNIQNRVQNLVNDFLTGIENPGEVPAPPQSVGNVTYNFTGLNAESQQDGTLRRSVESGTVVLNSNGTWSFAGQERGGQLTESCSSSCARTFTQSAVNLAGTDSGTYVRIGNGRIILQNQSGETILIFTNPTETILIASFSDVSGFGVAIKQGSGLSNSTVRGTTFNWNEFGSRLQNTQSLNNTWPGPLQSEIGAGTIAFTGTNVTTSGNGSQMSQQVTCTLTGTGCALTALLTQNPSPTSFVSPYTVNSTGTLTVENTGPDGVAIGTVSADGNVALVPLPHTNGGNMVIATKQATGLSNASLNGIYNIVIFGELLTTAGAIITFEDVGTVQNDGVGNSTIQTIRTSVSRSESCTLTTCGIGTAAIAGNSFTETRPYTLTDDGRLTIISPTAGTINGFVSPDATFSVDTNSFDNAGGVISGRVIAVAVKRS